MFLFPSRFRKRIPDLWRLGYSTRLFFGNLWLPLWPSGSQQFNSSFPNCEMFRTTWSDDGKFYSWVGLVTLLKSGLLNSLHDDFNRLLAYLRSLCHCCLLNMWLYGFTFDVAYLIFVFCLKIINLIQNETYNHSFLFCYKTVIWVFVFGNTL